MHRKSNIKVQVIQPLSRRRVALRQSSDTTIKFSHVTLFYYVFSCLITSSTITGRCWCHIPLVQHSPVRPWPVMSLFSLHQLFRRRLKPGGISVGSRRSLMLLSPFFHSVVHFSMVICFAAVLRHALVAGASSDR